jgi:hypothetical protein
MKRISLFSMSLVALALSASPVAIAGPDDHKPMHGGMYLEHKVVDVELVLKPEMATIYLRDHAVQLTAKGAKAKLTFLADGKQTEAMMDVTADSKRLEAKGPHPAAKGTKVVALVTMPDGKAATFRFEVK